MAFLIGCCVGASFRSGKRALLVSAASGVLVGGSGTLLYLPEAWDVPSEYIKFSALAAFWAGLFAVVGDAAVVAAKSLVRRIRESL